MAKWNLDPEHTAAEFTARHMMVTRVRGKFDSLSGYIDYDADNKEASYVEASFDVASVNTGGADRDNHLRSTDFFNVEAYPTMTFKSTNIEVTGEDTAKMTGDLTIRDVTHPVTLDVTYVGRGTSPFGDTRIGFEAVGKINREDWGLTWNVALESGGVLVSKEIEISISAQGVLETEAEASAEA